MVRAKAVVWAQEPAAPLVQERAEFGTNTGHGNLLGIQPFVRPTDYTSGVALRAKLAGYLDIARDEGWLCDKTIVVFPEYVGTWLAAAGGKPAVYRADTLQRAMLHAMRGRLGAFVAQLFTVRARDRAKAALFAAQARQMAGTYDQVFADLAGQYQVTIVAGSIVLPAPEVREGRLVLMKGRLYNVSAVYRADGMLYPELVHKCFPLWSELEFLAAGCVRDLPVYDTPAGKLGVLICADSWYPQCYGVLAGKGAQIIVVPSYLRPDHVWSQPWRGYDGAAAPADVDAEDIGRLTEGQAWLKYALGGRCAVAGIASGINVFLRGDLWDLGSDGHTVVVRGSSVLEARHGTGAAIVNSWIVGPTGPQVIGKD